MTDRECPQGCGQLVSARSLSGEVTRGVFCPDCGYTDPDADGPTDVDAREVMHVTGDYYFDRDAHGEGIWAVAVFLCIFLPPVGVFLVAYLFTDSLTTDVPDAAQEVTP